MNLRLVLISTLALAWLPAVPAAEVLYATSIRSPLGSDSAPAAGSLYRIDPATAASSLVGRTSVGGQEPIGVTGLADHPMTGALYGVTSPTSPTHPNSLVTIDLSNGDAALVGKLGAAASDIAFNRNGTLFAWLRESSQMATVDLSTGLARPLGRAGPAGEPGGVAIDSSDRIYVIGTGATGSLDLFDVATGTLSKGPGLKETPFAAGINSLTFSSAGAIYAVNTNLGSPASTLLVKIDPASGSVTKIGPLPPDTDALVFVEVPWSFRQFASSRGNLSLFAAVVCLVLAVVAVFALRKRDERKG